MHKIIVKYYYSSWVKGQYSTWAEAVAGWNQLKDVYHRQGYGQYPDMPDEETHDDEEWVCTMTRVPFEGRTGDPATGEVTYTPTGMTDIIELHMNVQPRGQRDRGIPFPANPVKDIISKR